MIATHEDAAIGIVGGIRLERGDVEVDVTLLPPTRVTGRLVDGGGQPVAGTVVLSEIDGVASSRTVGALVRATAAADGRFTLERVPAGSHGARVTARGAGAARTSPLDVPAARGTVDIGDVVLEAGIADPRPRARQGRGADRRRRRARVPGPAPMARRRARRDAPRPTAAFVLGGATAGAYQSVRPRARLRALHRSGSRRPATALEVVLAAAGSITGTVVDAAGRPVETFEVIAMPARGHAADRRAAGRSPTRAAASTSTSCRRRGRIRSR